MTTYSKRRIKKSLIFLGALALVLHYLDSRGYLHGLQMAFGLDPMINKQTIDRPEAVTIVNIDNEDYRDFFCAQSPLDPRGVVALIKAVRDTLHPHVIGVDLDTSEWNVGSPWTCTKSAALLCVQAAKKEKKKGKGKHGGKGKQEETPQQCFEREIAPFLPDVGSDTQNGSGRQGAAKGKQHAPTETAQSAPQSAGETKVIWAQVPGEPRIEPSQQESGSSVISGTKFIFEGEEDDSTALPLGDVAGRRIPADSWAIGVPRFPLDPDGVVRRYRRDFRVVENPKPGSSDKPEPVQMSSLSHALVKAYDSTRAQADTNEDIILTFLKDKHALDPIQAKYLLPTVAGSSPVEKPDSPPVNQEQIKKAVALRLTGIVLIGGTYKAARDTYRTPLGIMSGVELVGEAVESELWPNKVQETSGGWKLLADLAAGLLIIVIWNLPFVSSHMSARKIFIVSLILVGAAAVLFSRWLFYRHGVWLDSVVILAGVLAHQVYEELEKIEEYEEDLKQREDIIKDRDNTIVKLVEMIEDSRLPGI